MPGTRIDATSFLRAARKLGIAAGRYREEISLATYWAGARASAAAKDAAPKHTGALANSIHMIGPVIRRRQRRFISRVEVATPLPYAAVMERGRRPGARRPPIGPIARWVHLKVRRGQMQLRPGESVDEVALLVARSIARKGIKGRFFFRKAGEVAREYLVQHVRVALARLSRGR